MFSFLQVSFLESLKELDRWLFIKVNTGTANPVFDQVMPFVRNGANWAPLYLFIGVFVVLNFRGKGLWWSMLFLVTVAMTDMVGTNLFKHQFMRPRPCGDIDFVSHVRLLVNHCGGYSFISNHAANHFGMATFFFVTLRPVVGRWAYIAFGWAALVGFAQIYVGLHYPADVLCGALVGMLIGFVIAKLFIKRFGFHIFDKPTISS